MGNLRQLRTIRTAVSGLPMDACRMCACHPLCRCPERPACH
ncbi:hypothetical protein AAEX63_00620 [Luteococcus sp. H138]